VFGILAGPVAAVPDKTLFDLMQDAFCRDPALK
jgi:hypothetical protein